MLRFFANRKYVKRILLWGLLPIGAIVGIVFEDAISEAADDAGVTDAVASVIGFVMTSLWGAFALALFFIIFGSVATLYIEDWIKQYNRQPGKKKEAMLFAYADDKHDPHMYNLH